MRATGGLLLRREWLHGEPAVDRDGGRLVALARGLVIWGAISAALMLCGTSWALAQHATYRMLSLGGYPVRWLPSRAPGRVVLSYKIADGPMNQPHAINCKGMRPPTTIYQSARLDEDGFRDALSTAFHRWRDVADIAFVEVQPHEPANIVIGEQTDPIGFAFTNLDLAKEPQGGVRAILGASICLNPKRSWKIGYDGNLAVYDLVHTFAHEIGHVIGLDHPIGRASLMSFRYTESLSGLSKGDQLGAIAIYGPSRMQSEVAAVPVPGGLPGATTITTTIGRSIEGGGSE